MGSAPSVPGLSSSAEKSQRRLAELSELSESDLPERFSRDGRLLADFALFLHEGGRQEEVLHLWALDLASAGDWNGSEEVKASCFAFAEERREQIVEACCQLVEALEASWQEYQASPEGLGNFDDKTEWMPHDFPDPAILEKIHRPSDGKHSQVSEDHANYAFSICAMVGIHVSTVCSDLLMARALEAAVDVEQLAAAFQRRVPLLDFEICTREQVRVFPVPPNGSAYSPQTCLDHPFQIEEFAPRLFAQVRRSCGISSAKYFESVCRTDFQFIEFGTNSKSGELFFFTYDLQYLVKTTSELEAKTLLEMLPSYLERLREEPRSLLGRYLGLYRVTMEGEEPRLFFVMRSVTTHTKGICHTYDIKGSYRNRKVKKDESVGKDVNFDEEMGDSLHLPPDVAQEVAEVHQGDVEFLQEFRIMDFSLLVQINDTTGSFGDLMEEHSVKLRARRRWSGLKLPLLSFAIRSSKRSRTRRATLRSNSLGPRRSSGSVERGRTDKSLSSGHQVQVRAGSTAGAWTRQGTFSQLPQSSRTPRAPKWLPNDGSLVRKDGSMLYTMGLIDMLVPFTAYPKMQYVGMEVITCGHGTESSRVPPDFYGERQIEKVHSICDQEPPFID